MLGRTRQKAKELVKESRRQTNTLVNYLQKTGSTVYGSKGDGSDSWFDIATQFIGFPRNTKKTDGTPYGISEGFLKNFIGWQNYESTRYRRLNYVAAPFVFAANTLLAPFRFIVNLAKLVTEALPTIIKDNAIKYRDHMHKGKKTFREAFADLTADLANAALFVGRAITSPVKNFKSQSSTPAKVASFVTSSAAWLLAIPYALAVTVPSMLINNVGLIVNAKSVFRFAAVAGLARGTYSTYSTVAEPVLDKIMGKVKDNDVECAKTEEASKAVSAKAEPVKAAAPKAEAPKAEAPKAEAPKAAPAATESATSSTSATVAQALASAPADPVKKRRRPEVESGSEATHSASAPSTPAPTATTPVVPPTTPANDPIAVVEEVRSASPRM